MTPTELINTGFMLVKMRSIILLLLLVNLVGPFMICLRSLSPIIVTRRDLIGFCVCEDHSSAQKAPKERVM